MNTKIKNAEDIFNARREAIIASSEGRRRRGRIDVNVGGRVVMVGERELIWTRVGNREENTCTRRILLKTETGFQVPLFITANLGG